MGSVCWGGGSSGWDVAKRGKFVAPNEPYLIHKSLEMPAGPNKVCGLRAVYKGTSIMMATKDDTQGDTEPGDPSDPNSQGALPVPRPAMSAAAELIVRYLGPGDMGPDKAVWMNNQFGRPSMVQLQTWHNGAQTAIIIDSARPSWDAVSTIDLGAADGPELHELERALRRLTTNPPPPRGGGHPPGGTPG